MPSQDGCEQARGAPPNGRCWRMDADEVLEEASEYGLKGAGSMQRAHKKSEKLRA